MELIIATRKSKLAQVQTEKVMELLKKKENVDSKKLLVMTEGDRRLDVSLNKIGGKGLFVKEIELALLNKEAHGAVHSMKDMPSNLPEGLKFASIPKREDARDVLVLKEGYSSINDLPNGAKVATGSKRRKYHSRKCFFYNFERNEHKRH